MYSYKVVGESTAQRSDGWFIPFVSENTMYQQFKADVMAGAELEDADGNLMTPEEAKAFVATLP